MARFPKHYKKQYDMAQRAEKTLLPPPLSPQKNYSPVNRKPLMGE
jgi:hypothetical protein